MALTTTLLHYICLPASFPGQPG